MRHQRDLDLDAAAGHRHRDVLRDVARVRESQRVATVRQEGVVASEQRFTAVPLARGERVLDVADVRHERFSRDRVDDVTPHWDRPLQHPDRAGPEPRRFRVRTGARRSLRVADLGQERVVAEVAELPLVVLAVGTRTAVAPAIAGCRRQRDGFALEIGAQLVLVAAVAVQRLPTRAVVVEYLGELLVLGPRDHRLGLRLRPCTRTLDAGVAIRTPQEWVVAIEIDGASGAPIVARGVVAVDVPKRCDPDLVSVDESCDRRVLAVALRQARDRVEGDDRSAVLVAVVRGDHEERGLVFLLPDVVADLDGVDAAPLVRLGRAVLGGQIDQLADFGEGLRCGVHLADHPGHARESRRLCRCRECEDEGEGESEKDDEVALHGLIRFDGAGRGVAGTALLDPPYLRVVVARRDPAITSARGSLSPGVRLDPLTFLSRLAALIPPPRAHLLTYHGVLAPGASQPGTLG